MTSQQLSKLKMPETPGVYIFRDYRKRPLYIGRATSLRDRVRSYFGIDLIDTRGPRIVDMITKAKSLTWQETSSVLEAILLETELIKRYQPFYNVDERDDKSSQYVIITEEAWPRVFLARARDFDQQQKLGILPYTVRRCFGPFPHGGLIKEALKILRKLFPFKDKKALDPRHDLFYRALGQSPEEDEEARRRYIRTISHLILFFEGKKELLQTQLKREMKRAAKEMRFEDAGRAKKLLFALDHVNDMALIKQDRPASTTRFRIEAYDIAHISGTHAVGAMVVSDNSDFNKSEYRKFKLSRSANNDLAGLKEVLERRLNHSEWQYPDLIVVDGNEMQVRQAEGVLQARRISIPVVAVTKDERHEAGRLIGNPVLADKYKKEIIALNAECHRFAIAFHRLRRHKGMNLI